MGQDAWEQPVAAMVALLAAHEELIHRVLTGEAPATQLLTIADLRPGRLAAREPDLMPVWQQVGDLLADQAGRLMRPVSLADLGGATLDNPHLSAVVDRASIASTVLPAGRPHPGEASFDTVLAVGSLHRWADPEDAVRTVATLLRPGGTLIAVENTELSPLGLLIAGLLENGFTDATGKPVDAPTQDEDTWLQLLDSAALQTVSTPVGPTPAVLIHAQKTADRSSRQTSPAQPVSIAGPIRPGTETEVARLWSQLLQAAPRSRADSFFELGGDSLRATRLIAAVQQRYGVTIAMRELFARPQLAAVAQRIDAAISEVGDDPHEEGVL
ncbi:MAG: phosphopantetheine-binding protein [Dermatophilaceae bacterium]